MGHRWVVILVILIAGVQAGAIKRSKHHTAMMAEGQNSTTATSPRSRADLGSSMEYSPSRAQLEESGNYALADTEIKLKCPNPRTNTNVWTGTEGAIVTSKFAVPENRLRRGLKSCVADDDSAAAYFTNHFPSRCTDVSWPMFLDRNMKIGHCKAGWGPKKSDWIKLIMADYIAPIPDEWGPGHKDPWVDQGRNADFFRNKIGLERWAAPSYKNLKFRQFRELEFFHDAQTSLLGGNEVCVGTKVKFSIEPRSLYGYLNPKVAWEIRVGYPEKQTAPELVSMLSNHETEGAERTFSFDKAIAAGRDIIMDKTGWSMTRSLLLNKGEAALEASAEDMVVLGTALHRFHTHQSTYPEARGAYSVTMGQGSSIVLQITRFSSKVEAQAAADAIDQAYVRKCFAQKVTMQNVAIQSPVEAIRLGQSVPVVEWSTIGVEVGMIAVTKGNGMFDDSGVLKAEARAIMVQQVPPSLHNDFEAHPEKHLGRMRTLELMRLQIVNDLMARTTLLQAVQNARSSDPTRKQKNNGRKMTSGRQHAFTNAKHVAQVAVAGTTIGLIASTAGLAAPAIAVLGGVSLGITILYSTMLEVINTKAAKIWQADIGHITHRYGDLNDALDCGYWEQISTQYQKRMCVPLAEMSGEDLMLNMAYRDPKVWSDALVDTSRRLHKIAASCRSGSGCLTSGGSPICDTRDGKNKPSSDDPYSGCNQIEYRFCQSKLRYVESQSGCGFMGCVEKYCSGDENDVFFKTSEQVQAILLGDTSDEHYDMVYQRIVAYLDFNLRDGLVHRGTDRVQGSWEQCPAIRYLSSVNPQPLSKGEVQHGYNFGFMGDLRPGDTNLKNFILLNFEKHRAGLSNDGPIGAVLETPAPMSFLGKKRRMVAAMTKNEIWFQNAHAEVTATLDLAIRQETGMAENWFGGSTQRANLTSEQALRITAEAASIVAAGMTADAQGSVAGFRSLFVGAESVMTWLKGLNWARAIVTKSLAFILDDTLLRRSGQMTTSILSFFAGISKARAMESSGLNPLLDSPMFIFPPIPGCVIATDQEIEDNDGGDIDGKVPPKDGTHGFEYRLRKKLVDSQFRVAMAKKDQKRMWKRELAIVEAQHGGDDGPDIATRHLAALLSSGDLKKKDLDKWRKDHPSNLTTVDPVEVDAPVVLPSKPKEQAGVAKKKKKRTSEGGNKAKDGKKRKGKVGEVKKKKKKKRKSAAAE